MVEPVATNETLLVLFIISVTSAVNKLVVLSVPFQTSTNSTPLKIMLPSPA